MKDVLTFILTHTLGADIKFAVEQTEDEQGIVFNINLPEAERGKIIGKGGVLFCFLFTLTCASARTRAGN